MMNTKRLLDVCDFQGGTQPPKDEWVNDPREGYVRMLQIRDYSQGDAKFVQYVKDTKRLHKCTKDDIMLSRYGYIGQAFIGLEGAYNVALVKVVKKEEMHTPYLFYYFQSYYFQHFLLSNVGARATIPGFNKDELENALIRIPEMCEQIEIASKIAKVDELIDLHKQQINILEILVKSRFIELFGDPIKNTQHRPTTAFVNVVTMQRGFDLPVQDREQSGNIPVYGSNGVLDHHNQAKVCNGGVITGRSGTIGKVFYTEGAYWPLNTTLFSVDTHENNIIYLAHLLRMFNLARFTEGTGVPTLNRNKFHSAPIIDVPIDEQNQFAAFVEQTDKSKLAVQQGLEKLETLKKSLMQQYFG